MTDISSNKSKCGHCGTPADKAKLMVQLANGTHVCDRCIDEMTQFLADSLASASEAAPGSPAAQAAGRMRTPKEIVAFLDQYIVGQDDAKRTLAIAVYGHYKRLAQNQANPETEIGKSNILLIGPTGTGKTLLAQSIAKLLDVPFTIADATSLTQAGYVGDDVETILQRLVQAADGDIEKAERGIVFIDEIDKLAKAGAGVSITRDVGGEGVQQALLKLIEGAKVSVPVTGNRKTPGAAAQYVDTKNILFVCAGAFVQLLEKKNPANKPATMGFTNAAPTPEQHDITPDDLFEFGMIPEFVGRLPVITALEPLSQKDLERVLVEPRNAVVRQMKERFAMEGATLTFEDGAIAELAKQAQAMKTGARGARSILERLLKNALFEVPGTQGIEVVVDKALNVTLKPAAEQVRTGTQG